MGAVVRYNTAAMHGYLALALVAHVPYLRAAGREPLGEDALHETLASSIVPTLNVLFDARELGIRPAVALAYSPVLLEQLADNVIQKHFAVWMERWLDARAADLARWERGGLAHLAYLARFYLDWGQGVLRSFLTRYGRNPVAALRDLCADGTLEPLAGAATHAYLPLLERRRSLQAQLEAGALSVTRRLGRRPRGLWLPECGFAPPLAQAAQGAGARYIVVDPASAAAAPGLTHLRPRWVVPRRLVAVVRDADAAAHVWSADLGYPGDPLYRSPRRDGASGLSLWRHGTGAELELYDPYEAFRRAEDHAEHFVQVVAAELEAFGRSHDRPGLALVPLDADVLGRRWFEGPHWLNALLMRLGGHATVRLTTPSAYIRAYRPRQNVVLRDGSWGPGGDHRMWHGAGSTALLQAMAETEATLARVARRLPHVTGDRERALNQALRELLLAQGSDWPLLAGRGASEPIPPRVAQHLARCEQLCALAEQPELHADDIAYLDELEELDNAFPELNYRVFVPD
jgi:1,4-alpha-glucan branching enzyme